MRDFQADVIRAARSGKPLPEGGFSWSPARMHLLRFCQRAYFIRYYLAQGGWNIHADPPAKTAYMEKHLPTFEQFISRTLESSVKDALYYAVQREKQERRPIFKRALLQGLERRITALVVSLSREDYLSDPKLPGLLEAYHHREDFKNPEDVGARCAGIFRNVLPTLLEEKEVMEMVDNLSPLALRRGEEFLALPWRSFTVWLHAGIIYTTGDTVTSLRFCSGITPADHGLDAALFHEYARQKMRREKTRYNVFQFHENGETKCETIEPGPVAADRVEVSSIGMIRMVRSDGQVYMDDFQPTADTEKCSDCPFQQTCSNLRK